MTTEDEATAANLFHQSQAARARGAHDVAGRLLRASFKISQDLPGVWYQWANDLPPEAAVAALHRVLQHTPDEPYTLANIGWHSYTLGRYHDAVDYSRWAVERDPELSLAWSNLSLAYQALGRADDAITAGRRAAAASDDTRCALAYSFALMKAGRWAEGLRQYEARFANRMPEMLAFEAPRWDGSYVSTLFVPAEQGFGDTIQFSRFLQAARERVGHLVFGVQEELASLYQDEVSCVRMPCAVPKMDAVCPLMSLPVAMGLTDEQIEATGPFDFRYLVDEERAPGRRRIGIVWAGSPENENDHHRSMTLDTMLRLASLSDVQLHSFQLGPQAEHARRLAPLVVDESPDLRTFEDTAAALLGMDSVVSVCTAVAHLAGSLGIDTHVIPARHGRHFVWGYDNGATCWYPSVTVHGSIESVLSALAAP